MGGDKGICATVCQAGGKGKPSRVATVKLMVTSCHDIPESMGILQRLEEDAPKSWNHLGWKRPIR